MGKQESFLHCNINTCQRTTKQSSNWQGIMKSFIFCIYTLVSLMTTSSETPTENTSSVTESSPNAPVVNLDVSTNLKQITPQSMVPKQVLFRPRFSITRLTKSFNYDYDPFFNKDDFLPFETRKRPVKMLMFKRNRIQPQIPLQENKGNLGIAEQQSPYNELVDTLQDSNDFTIN